MIKCWHYRKIISRSVDVDAPLPAPAQNHVRSCPACREHYESQTTITRQLSAGANAQKRLPSPFLHARIMSSIASAQREGERRPLQWGPGWAAALATACVVLAAMLWLRFQPRPEGPAPGHGPVALEVSSPGDLPDGMQLREWAATLDEPLQKEMQLVLNDTTSAMNSLAANFLPEKFRSSLFEQSQN